MRWTVREPRKGTEREHSCGLRTNETKSMEVSNEHEKGRLRPPIVWRARLNDGTRCVRGTWVSDCVWELPQRGMVYLEEFVEAQRVEKERQRNHGSFGRRWRKGPWVEERRRLNDSYESINEIDRGPQRGSITIDEVERRKGSWFNGKGRGLRDRAFMRFIINRVTRSIESLNEVR